MILIVYRKDGKITHVHENRINPDELPEKLRNFNAESKHGEVAEVIVCDEVMEWLYTYRQANIKDFRETLERLEDQINDLGNSCNWISDLIKQEGAV